MIDEYNTEKNKNKVEIAGKLRNLKNSFISPNRPSPTTKPCRASSIGRASIPSPAGLAQSVERETLNLKVAGSTPAFGYSYKIT
ncbi:hypothetical protein N7523_005146 [Penicillium sp. IBT 18751x]|nr:hypothetical protein N7523_005146 [Penicillium sp. IBT 18751x]